ncbi:low molecular weight protein-tyrosine-phosphatase [Wenjunlia tyrosinilytica]|uniref:low molecular weight protein-tyrosine-phosphatase n=1 Tax=Wenjunlia tyrosinilytica TaxID=1544741 RepID=UPI00224692C2|nr:low molecular weight protein-tyrosine-phosphatase [Wenjunlia tyrosinilytica]
MCFVCTANICRSPMAASVFRARVREAGLSHRVEVDSAGTGGWFEGEGADLRTVAVLARNGYEDEHTARQFRPEWFAERDLVVALDEGHLLALRRLARGPVEVEKVRLLRSFDPGAAEDEMDVPDPYYGGIERFQLCLDLIEAAATGLMDEVRGRLAEEPGNGDGADPL